MGSNDREFTRRIQFSGRSSYTVALPMSWVKETGLTAGAEVSIIRRGDGSLVISPRSSEIVDRKVEVLCELAQNASQGSIARRLISLYLLGYNVIHAKLRDGRLSLSQRNAIKEVVRRNMIGTEIIADSPDGMTLQVLLSFPQLGINDALKRMFLLSSSMHRDAINSLKELDKEQAEGVIRADDEVDRFNLYLIRLLNMALRNGIILKQIGLKTPNDCLGYRLIVKSVERVADHASGIAEEVIGMHEKIDRDVFEKVKSLSEEALGVFEESGLALLKQDYNSADNVVEHVGSVISMERRLMKEIHEIDPTLLQTLRLIIEHIRRTAEYASDISEAVINMNAEKFKLD